MSDDKFPQPIDYSFTAPIEKDGAFPTYVTAAGTVEFLGTGRAVRVEGTIDGVPFAATLMPSGHGPHWLPLRAAICKSIGKSAADERVTIQLLKRLS